MCLHFRKLLCILAFCPQVIFAQSKNFTAFSDDPATFHALNSRYQKVFDLEAATLPKENRKELREIYLHRHNQIKEKIDEKEIYLNPAAVEYLQKLTDEIIAHNPSLPDRKPACYFSRSGIPNASSLGEGLIVFNMGLFTKLANESQAAFIIAHELAHHYLRHSENSISEYVSVLYSSETQQALKGIKKRQFNKREQLESLTKRISFDTHRHSRDHESEADSMAFQLLRNTNFQLGECLSTLALLDSIDLNSFPTADVLNNTFDAAGYPFKKRWLKKETGLLGGHAKIESDGAQTDSLKTHPDCKARIKALEPLVKKYDSPLRKPFVIDQQQFERFKWQFDYEIIEYAYNAGKLSSSLFYTLILLQKSPEEPYLIAQTGRIFKGFYDAQKAHTLGKVAALPSPDFSESYNMLLQFVNNLYLEDYAAIGFHFLKKHESALKTDQNYHQLYTALAAIAQ